MLKIELVERSGRLTVATGTPWEPVMGYSRAVRSGNLIAVTGSVGIDPGGRIPIQSKDKRGARFRL
jgi:enamine deaminase RidA (YjgF/YER057c/UK114 family)